MISFAALLLREQPRINRALLELADDLPRAVRPVARHAIEAGGKRLRPLLVVLMARALGYDHADIYALAGTMEMFHMATLIHDDVLDNAETRRGKPAAHRAFGLGRAVLAADALYARGCGCVAGFGDPRLVTCLTEAVVRTTAGEIDEFDLQGKIEDSLDAYYAVITGKTAWMLRASAELGALRAGAAEEDRAAAAEYGLNLGMAFQIADDALDFEPMSKTGKPEGGDVREAKFTPPIYFYARSLPPAKRAQFSERFAARSFSDADVNRIVHEIREGGFQEQTLALSDAFLDTSLTALNRIRPASGEGTSAHNVLRDAVRFVRDRRK